MKRLAQVILILFAALTTSLIRAQETAPEATPEATIDTPAFVSSWSAQVLYPAAVRFDLTLDLPIDQINSLNLSIEPQDRPPVSVALSPQSISLLADEFTVMGYVWRIQPENAPGFLTEVRYQWTVLTDAGSAVLPGSVAFTDDRSLWRVEPDPDMVLNLILPLDDQDVADIRRLLRPIYSRLAAITQQYPVYNLILFSEDIPADPCPADGVIRDPVTEAAIPCDPALVAAIYAGIGYVPLQTRSRSLRDVQLAVANIMIEDLIGPILPNETIPPWFTQGIRTFFQPSGKGLQYETTRSAARANRLLLLAEMEQTTPTDPVLWEAQSAAMVIYLARLAGIDGLTDLLRRLAAGEPFVDSYEAVTGRALDTLIPNLRNWLFSDQAAADFSYNPYLPPTPSPTASLTNTPFPPTPTYTDTATVTPTLTPTVTGFQTATPLPTITPRATRTRAAASITPRPPGSVIPTLEVEAPTPVEDVDETTPPVAAGPLIVGAIFFAFGVVTVITLRILRQRS
jgi:hypothetical protein